MIQVEFFRDEEGRLEPLTSYLILIKISIFESIFKLDFGTAVDSQP